MTNGDFKISLRGNVFYVQIIENLSSKLWADKWGKVEEKIRIKRFAGNMFDTIRISFVDCKWADPLPLLSILMLLIKVKNEIKIDIILPCIVVKVEKDNDNYAKGQFLKFLATQGFMKIMIDNFFVIDAKGRKLSEKNIIWFQKYKYNTWYGDAQILKAQIFDASQVSVVKDFVHKLQNEIAVNLKGQLSLAIYYSMITQIYNILTELIENVKIHAYTKDEQQLFSVYIRKRCGEINNYEQKEDIFKKVLSKERENCPALGTEILVSSESLLEIFFIDLGIGISGSLEGILKNIKNENYKYPVRELITRILRDGERSQNRKTVTAYGGLHFITRVLRENKGYIWCKDGNEWIGAFCNDIVNDNNDKIDIALSNTKKQPTGLGWCFRLPYTDNSNRIYSILYSWEGKASTHPVFNEYKRRENDFITDRIVVYDEWENEKKTILIPGDVNKCIEITDYCFSEEDGIYKNFVWRPQSGNSKTSVIKFLIQFISDIVIKIAGGLQDVNIFIIDIDTSEIFSYFYAFDKLFLGTLKYYNINKIFLITKQWGVTCFRKDQDKLLYDSSYSKEYFYRGIKDSKNISDGICQLANFLRKYDSWVFWKKIEKMQNERIFINAEIKWSSKKTVKGYLDLDTLYLYDELYSQLKNTLVRLSGFEKNVIAEYRSIDVTSARICRELNTSLVLREEGRKFVMNIGGVCASGYTKESFYGEQKVDSTFIFFAHPSFDKDFKDTAYLLIWPQESFFANFTPDLKLYKRMGQTNLISENQQESLINVENIYDNSIRNKKQGYEDFQQKYPKAVKYGHFQTDKHHYLIGIDINSYMQYGYIKKEGVFLFLLAKILFYLADDINTLNHYINQLEDNSWKQVLRKYNFSQFDVRGELIVYHSNSYTEYAMKFIRKIIPAFLCSRIMPVNFLNVQSKGTPLAFSPFMLEQIGTHYAKGQAGILYIDSSLYTGRSLVEIENILLSIGCGKVDFAAFVDMRRLRNIDKRSQSYWKLNIPRLDNKSQCIVCNTLNIARQIDSKLEPKARKRVQEWIKNWQYINIANNIKDHGIESIEDYNEVMEGIRISSTIGLNIYAAEHMCETFDDDFVYKFIQRKTDLSAETKMQLICTQLCLFGNQNSRQLQLSLLSELIGNIAKLENVSPYTSLAGLMLISQNKVTMYELLNEILFLNTVQKIEKIRNNFLQSNNMDLAIVIGYFIKTDNNIEALFSKCIEDDKHGLIELANNCYLPDKELKLISKKFLGLCVNEQGSSHNTSLEKLKEEHVTKIPDFVNRCNAARNDLQSIKELAKHFPLSMSSNVVMERFSYQRFVRDIDDTERLMDLDIDAYEKKEIQEGNQINSSAELNASIVNCKKDINILLNNFFIANSDETEQYFQKLCNRFEELHKKKIMFQYIQPEFRYKKWYYWNSGMEKELEYFLDNLKHCTKTLENYEDTVYMDFMIKFDLNYLAITIQSWSRAPAIAVDDKFKKDNRISKEHAEAFDVNFGFENVESRSEQELFLLETKMKVPSCYQTLREKENGKSEKKV